jgi:hypothetical protein
MTAGYTSFYVRLAECAISLAGQPSHRAMHLIYERSVPTFSRKIFSCVAVGISDAHSTKIEVEQHCS